MNREKRKVEEDSNPKSANSTESISAINRGAIR